MAKTDNHTEASTDQNASKLEAIKNLIFGENIAEYNDEFEAIKADINHKREVLEELIETTRTELNSAIDSLGTDLNIRITELEDAVENKIEALDQKKVDRKQLGDLLIKLGHKIGE